MELEVFKNAGFEIRGGLIKGEPYFVLADVCKALGLEQVSRVKDRLNKDGVTISKVIDSMGRTQQATFINESNLYKVIFQSRKEEAIQFQEWVTSEVLPSIRKHGAYLTPEKIEEVLLNPDTIIQLANQVKAEKEAKEKALKLIESQKPMVKFAKRIGSCASTLSIQDFAKVISDKTRYTIGQNRLYALLRGSGYLMRDNKPYQRYIDMGVFEVKEATYTNQTTNEEVAYLKTRVTAKGQQYLLERVDEIMMKQSA